LHYFVFVRYNKNNKKGENEKMSDKNEILNRYREIKKEVGIEDEKYNAISAKITNENFQVKKAIDNYVNFLSDVDEWYEDRRTKGGFASKMFFAGNSTESWNPIVLDAVKKLLNELQKDEYGYSPLTEIKKENTYLSFYAIKDLDYAETENKETPFSLRFQGY
jgi:hypothetical protein